MLMIIDVQNAIDDPRWGVRNNPDAEQTIAKLLSKWRELNLPLLHVRHMSTDPGSTYYSGLPGNDFKSIVRPKHDEQVLMKSTNSAFIDTGLDTMLGDQGITELIITGVITNNSVEATARMAGNLGYKTKVVSDATFTFGRNDFSGQFHEAEVVHNMSLANLHEEYAEVLDSKEIIVFAEELI
jgi:Amidases related to nicotinamidase